MRSQFGRFFNHARTIGPWVQFALNTGEKNTIYPATSSSRRDCRGFSEAANASAGVVSQAIDREHQVGGNRIHLLSPEARPPRQSERAIRQHRRAHRRKHGHAEQ